jgi:hypothetical protein
MTVEVKTALLEALSRSFAPVAVARGFGVSYECYRQHYHRDLAFRAAVEEARCAYVDHLRAEVHRRAVVGWLEPVIRRGKQIGTVRRHSDRLLLRHTAAFDSSYRAARVMDRRTGVGDRHLDPSGDRAAACAASGVSPRARSVAGALRSGDRRTVRPSRLC